jgi:hypothetical protein
MPKTDGWIVRGWLELPLLPRVKANDRRRPTPDPALIVTRRDKPWSKGALATEFAAAAGVFGKCEGTGGDLRLLGGRITTLYTKARSRTRLAVGAMGKLDPWRYRK